MAATIVKATDPAGCQVNLYEAEQTQELANMPEIELSNPQPPESLQVLTCGAMLSPHLRREAKAKADVV